MRRLLHGVRNERGAYAVTVGNGRKTLHVRSQQVGEDLGLRLAQLRKPLRGVGDRAVVLAELLTAGGRRAARSGSVPVLRQRLGQNPGALLGGGLLHLLTETLHLPPDPRTRELGDSGLTRLAATGSARDPAHRVRRELVVSLVEGVPAAVRQSEGLGGTATTSRAVHPLSAGLHHSVTDQGVQVAAHGSLRQLKALRQLGRGGRAVIKDGTSHLVTGAMLLIRRGMRTTASDGRGGRRPLSRSRVFHNAIVA